MMVGKFTEDKAVMHETDTVKHTAPNDEGSCRDPEGASPQITDLAIEEQDA